jgi:hypothetical protein
VDFAALYSGTGRPSIAPETLLRAMLLQAFYSVRTERQLMERLEYDLLVRWFVGLGVDDPVQHCRLYSTSGLVLAAVDPQRAARGERAQSYEIRLQTCLRPRSEAADFLERRRHILLNETRKAVYTSRESADQHEALGSSRLLIFQPINRMVDGPKGWSLPEGEPLR